MPNKPTLDAMHMAVMNQKVQKKAKGGRELVKSAISGLIKNIAREEAPVVSPEISGLIRNITRKEEPASSFMDLIKQKQEAGEYRTPFKFERAPAKSKQEIEALAERMAPQMRGEFVRGKDVSDTRSVAGLSRKEFERQKEMKTDIRRDLPEVKPVDIQNLEDNVIVGVSGDPSLAQADVFGINDVQLMSPVRSYGGPLYGVNNPAFWASGLGAATNLRSTAARASLAHGDAPVIGQFIKAPEGMGYALHTLDTLLAFQRPELLNKSKLQSLNKKIRAGQAGYGEFPHFVGFEDPDLVLLQAQHDPKLRTFLADTLMKPTVSKEYGLFHGQDVKAALTEPELRNVEAGATGFSMGRLFPDQSFTQSSHPTYEVDIPGEFMGRSKYLLPYELSFPDTLKFARENPEKGVSEYLRFKGSGPRQIVDPQYIDEIKMYEEAMKSRLGFKKGGAVNMKDGNLVDELIKEAKSKQEAPVNPFRMPTQKQSQYEKDFRQYLANQQAAREQLPKDIAASALSAPIGYAAQIPLGIPDLASMALPESVTESKFYPSTENVIKHAANVARNIPALSEYADQIERGMEAGQYAALPQAIQSIPAMAKGVAKGATAGSKALANEAAYRIYQAMERGEGPLAGALAGVAPRPLITWHGSPHRFPPTEKNPLGEFDPTKIGTGEGAQAYGYGHYLAEAPGTAHEYRARLAGRPEIVRLKVGNKAVGPYNQFDYSPKTSSTKENIHASLIEDLLIDESDLVAAHSSGGDKAIQKIIMDNLDRRIKDYADEWPEGIPYAKQLKDELSKRGSVSLKMGEKPGSFYAVNLPDEAIAKMLDWDKPLSEQPENVRKALEPFVDPIRKIEAQSSGSEWGDLAAPRSYDPTGSELMRIVAGKKDNLDVAQVLSGGTGGREVSDRLRAAGIPGIKYLDQASRGTGEGTRNFVVFPGNESLMNIVGREKKGGVIHKAEGGLTSDDLIVEETPL